MRFLLVNPYCPIAEGPTPPLGIAFLAAALEEAGIEVKILDLVITPYDKNRLEALLESFKPQIVGSSAVTMTFDDAIKVITDVKSINPGILTVMGGPHVSFCAEETLNLFSELDLIVLGEGEETIVELSREAEKGGEWKKVKGLAYRIGNEVRSTETRAPIDVDTLPLPARHLLPLGRYKALNTPISMTTSRGCPHRCIFCVGRKMVGAKVRYRNPQNVVDELEYLSTLNFPQINIADDLFTAKKDHCLAICNEIIKRKLDIKWSSFARVDTVSLEVLKKMREAGCLTVSFGVETANTGILKTIKKGITLPKVIKAIEMCVEAGVDPHVSFILGLPGETPETLMETQEFGETIDAIGASYGFHLLAPFPGTAVRDENDDFDLKILTNDWSKYHANRAIVETATVNREMLDAIAEKWDQAVLDKLSDIEKRMETGEASKDEAWQVENLERFSFIYDLLMNQTIEEKGSWLNGTNSMTNTEALEALSQRIYPFTTKSQKEALDILNYAFERGSLNYIQDQEHIRWNWKDYL
ncbi:MAG: radical SAM protein [Proteobacteria bacterium]|nr:radical SAM protein [Pseudomonadota bacterium]